ncbi:MAG TPA: hypothetical protein VFR02_10440 [bacterium]|nr:hypothetical protein [bacterium]
MRRFLKSLNRMFLAAGLLVALTPCGLCHAAGPSAGMSACAMKASDCGKDCCHSKQAPAACKAMDQSTLPATALSMKAPAAVAAPWTAPFRTACLAAGTPDRDLFGIPLPRAPLSLRI